MQMNSSSNSSTLSTETRLRQNRMSSSLNLPTHDQLKNLKSKKRLLQKGCELFNQKPSSGLEFLQENGLLSNPLNMKEIAEYLRHNPLLDKKVIGDYISNRKNNEVLEEYVKAFHFENMRIDEALRMYLSEFRLPGEAPLIFNLLEHFAARWRECNNFQLANNDAAFGLAYACIMLNTDQHNMNIRRQTPRMQCEDFIKNLSTMNNQGNFDEGMLREIFRAIRNDEIVMPAEHTGIVRESYLWKSMIRRSVTSNEPFLHAPTGSYNNDIFTLIWGQTMAALSFVFEKSNYDLFIEKSIQGFSKCTRIAAYYSMSDVFDNLVISLCKFTTLLNSREGNHRDFTWTETLPIQFGLNRKARLAATVVFNLGHVHGGILRDGSRNILECVIHLYQVKLLPSSLVEVEDLLDPSGRTSLIKEQVPQAPKNDTGLFSQLAYFLGGGGSTDSNTNADKQTTAEEQEAIKQATSCIEQCHLDQLFQETKFLLIDSLNELIKALIYTCQTSPDAPKLDQDVAVFSLEMLVRVVLQNRDRVTAFWSTIRNQFYAILVNTNEKSFFVERTCVGLLRIAARLLRREELTGGPE